MRAFAVPPPPPRFFFSAGPGDEPTAGHALRLEGLRWCGSSLWLGRRGVMAGDGHAIVLPGLLFGQQVFGCPLGLALGLELWVLGVGFVLQVRTFAI